MSINSESDHALIKKLVEWRNWIIWDQNTFQFHNREEYSNQELSNNYSSDYSIISDDDGVQKNKRKNPHLLRDLFMKQLDTKTQDITDKFQNELRQYTEQLKKIVLSEQSQQEEYGTVQKLNKRQEKTIFNSYQKQSNNITQKLQQLYSNVYNLPQFTIQLYSEVSNLHQFKIKQPTKLKVSSKGISNKSKLPDNHQLRHQTQQRCEFCEKVFDSLMDLWQHIKIFHSNDYYYKDRQCKYCGTEYLSRKKFYNHLRSSHQTELQNEFNKLF